MLLYDRNIVGPYSEIFGKWSEMFGKSLKTSLLVCLNNKQNITCPLVDMNFISSCSTRYLTRSLHSLLRFRVEHSKIKFIFTRGHVISSIYRSLLYFNDLYKITVPLKFLLGCDFCLDKYDPTNTASLLPRSEKNIWVCKSAKQKWNSQNDGFCMCFWHTDI